MNNDVHGRILRRVCGFTVPCTSSHTSCWSAVRDPGEQTPIFSFEKGKKSVISIKLAYACPQTQSESPVCLKSEVRTKILGFFLFFFNVYL